MKWPWRREERELDEEIAAHLEMAAEEYRRRGLPEEEARRRALIDFGGVGQAREAYREARGFARAALLWKDVRYAARSMRRDAGFAAMAVAILTLGIGANTAMFSIVNSVLLRPLPYPHAGRLVALEEAIPRMPQLPPVLPVNARHFLEWKRHAGTLEDAALLDGDELNLTGAGEPERVNAMRTTPNLFDLLGVRAQIGRTFTPEDAPEKVAVITDGLWRRRFGGVAGAAGQSVALNGVPHRIVGVLPRSWRDPFERQIELYLPWEVQESVWGWAGDHNYHCVGRLREGATVREAAAELDVLQARIATRFEVPGKLDLLIRITPLSEHVTGRSRPALLTLMAAVGVVLLIACLNLGNLMLARSVARSREMAVRAALGASTARILCGITVEGLLLSVAGAALGIVFARALLGVFGAASPAGLARADEVSLDAVAVLFALALAAATSALFALLPAWQMRRIDPQQALRAGGPSITDSRARLRLREVLTGVEAGLSVALLVLAGLLVRSALRLEAVDRGYDAANVLTAEVSLPESHYRDPESRRRFFAGVLDALRNEPRIVAAGVISKLPLRGERWSTVATAEGDTRPLAEVPILSYRPATPDYFRAMGIPLLAGRTMEDRDYPRLAAVLSARAAERVWPGQDPIGKRFSRGDPDGPWFEVVGVAGDVRGSGIDQAPQAIVYVPLWVRTPQSASVAVRAAGDPASVTAQLRRAVWSVDSQVPLADVMTMSGIERQSTAYRRFLMQLVMAFAAAALLIAALGTYSVLAWSTARRKAEIGVRMALGAGAAEVRAMILRQGMRPVICGSVAGLAVAWAAGQALSSLLFQVGARDPLTYALVVAVTTSAALAACWIPAYRASRIPPVQALRYE